MPDEFEATIINGGILGLNRALVAEIAALTSDPDEAKRKIIAIFGEGAEDRIDIPGSGAEYRERALAVIREIGRAAGKEMLETGCRGDKESCFQAFRQGAARGVPPEEIIGCSRDKLCYMCGYESVGINMEAVRAFWRGVEDEWGIST
jgi:hypothetical protein